MAELDTPKIVEEITHVRTGPWAVNYYGTCTAGGLAAELKAAPTRASSATYLTHVTMGIVSDANHILTDARFTLVDGVGDEVFGPVQFCDSGQTLFSKDFKHPLKITDGKALDLSVSCPAGSYQASCFVYIEGYTGDNPIT